MSKVHSIALDIGSGYCKSIYLPESGDTSEMQRLVKSFKTAVGPSRNVTLQPGVRPLVVEFEDKSFYVGNTAEVALSPDQRTNSLSPEWAYEDGYRALVYYIVAKALTSEGIEPSDTPIQVHLITGLPQAYYEVGAERLSNIYSNLHRFRHAWQTWVIDMVNVQVVPQAMGALYSATETLLSDEEYSERVGVIDIGTFTSDFCLSEDVVYHAHESGGAPIGVSALVSSMRTVLERDLGFNYTDESIKKAFERGTVLVRSAPHDIQKQLDEVITQSGRQLVKALPPSWDTNTMHLVLAGGGGADHFFGKFFKKEYPHIKVISHPENAIVLGYGIYGASAREA